MYYNDLGDWAVDNGVRLPIVPVNCEQSFHMFYLLMPNLQVRTEFIKFLKAKGVMAVFHYLPLHLSDMGRKFGGFEGEFPVTEKISDQLVRLPFYFDLDPGSQEKVIEAILEFKSF